MVTFTKEDKNIIIPCSLGNISTGSGGSGVTPEDVEIMIDQAIDTYDEGIQGQFDSTNTAVSGNTENIEAISAETQSIANDLDSLGNSVENLSAVTSGISNDLTSLGNDVESLSGKTEEIEGRLRNYTTTAVTAELSAVTSGIATDLETLSANTTVVSWEQSLSAGTQIAQITINGQSQSVYAPEGGAGGDSNYVIVDALSAITNPVEGMIAFVSGRTYTEVVEGYKCQRNRAAGNEGDVARIYLDGNELARVYQSGPNFFWDWTNNGLWNTFDKEYNGNHYPIEYKTYNEDSDNMNSYFVFEKSLGGLAELGATVTPEGGDQATVTDYSEDVQKIQINKFYQRQSGKWQEIAAPDVYLLEDMSQQELVALYNKILNAVEGGEVDFGSWRFYGYNRDTNVPFEYLGIVQEEEQNKIKFGAVTARWNDTTAIFNKCITLNSAGTLNTWAGEIRNTEIQKLSIIRDASWFKCDRGTYSGFTFDCSQVPDYTEKAVYYDDPNWSWYFGVNKWDGGNLYNPDFNPYPDDNKWYYISRENRCSYYCKRTGQTISVAFVLNGPASIDSMTVDANVTYTALTETMNTFSASNHSQEDEGWFVATGDTCSNEYQFEVVGIRDYCDGVDDGKHNPVFAFRCVSGNSIEQRFANPVVYYERISRIVLYDKNGSPFDFDYKFYIDYGKYLITLIGNESEYRYARLTITANQ